MTKTKLLELIHATPERGDGELDVDRLLYTLYVRRRIELGLTDADTSDEFSQEEFDRIRTLWTVRGIGFTDDYIPVTDWLEQ